MIWNEIEIHDEMNIVNEKIAPNFLTERKNILSS